MPSFQYEAIDPQGNHVTGMLNAPSQEAALAQLHETGHYPIKATPAKAAPVVLTEAQMDQVAAGQLGICVVCTNLALPIALNVLAADSTATAATGEQTINVGTGG